MLFYLSHSVGFWLHTCPASTENILLFTQRLFDELLSARAKRKYRFFPSINFDLLHFCTIYEREKISLNVLWPCLTQSFSSSRCFLVGITSYFCLQTNPCRLNITPTLVTTYIFRMLKLEMITHWDSSIVFPQKRPSLIWTTTSGRKHVFGEKFPTEFAKRNRLQK